MIISSALLFVWFLQSKQTNNPEKFHLTQHLTQIRNKEITEVTVQTIASWNWLTKIKNNFMPNSTRAMRRVKRFLKAADEIEHESKSRTGFKRLGLDFVDKRFAVSYC